MLKRILEGFELCKGYFRFGIICGKGEEFLLIGHTQLDWVGLVDYMNPTHIIFLALVHVYFYA